MTQFILIPTIAEESRHNMLLTAYSMPAGPLSEQDRSALDKQRSLITFPLQELGLSATGFRAIDSVRRLLAEQGRDVDWLNNQRLYCSGKCEGASAELGLALALLLRDRVGELDIIASAALGGVGNNITIDAVAKLPEKLQLVLEQKQSGKLGDKNGLFFISNNYIDVDGMPRPVNNLPVISRLAEIGVDVIAVSQLSDILENLELLIPFYSTNHTLTMQKIILNHQLGSKANQTEIIEVSDTEIHFGRDDACQVIFDPEQDDLVSRVHCKLEVKDGKQFLLTDLGSRNGTFVNNSKISSTTELSVGDKVQLGKGGPQFIFDLDPKPLKLKETRLVENNAPATRVIHAAPSKDTVEAMITASESATRKKVINIGAGVLGGVFLILAYFSYQNSIETQPVPQLVAQSEPLPPPQNKENSVLSAADIFKQYGNSSVLIEASWKLIHTATGKQVFQRNECFVKQGKCITPKMPWYIQHNGVVEPFLDIDASNGIAIGSTHRGSGFVAHENGFILTNRHVAANWHAQSRNFQLPGILVDCNDATCSKPEYKVLDEKSNSAYLASLNQWIPSKTKMLGQKPLYGKIVEGRNDYLEVTFPNTGLRIPAHLVRVSDVADVAMIKIDLPQALQPVQLSADVPVSPGDSITVMGYPGISPEIVAKMKAQDPGGDGEIRSVPALTVTTGNIGKVLSAADKTDSASVSELFSSMGNVYQLTVNATGSGNSGGPVFNDKGQVIGLFTYGMSDQSGIQISFAVPIKYGRELMDITAIK